MKIKITPPTDSDAAQRLQFGGNALPTVSTLDGFEYRIKNAVGSSNPFLMTFARAPVVVTLDADLQNDPADIPQLLAKIGPYDVVCGVRVNRQDTWLRRISSRIAMSRMRRNTGRNSSFAHSRYSARLLPSFR